MINQAMYALGDEPSAIRELFAYGMARKAEVGAENVFDYFELTPKYAVFEIETPKEWEGRTVSEVDGRRRHNVNIRGVKNDDGEVAAYLTKILKKEAGDGSGLIYGMGHAVYSLSDPRAVIFHSFVERLSAEKGKEKEFALYTLVEQLAPKIIGEERKIYKGVSPNVDFYSGFAYSMLNLPLELYTPIFAIARIAGWSAHRLEELSSNGKIMRPAYKYVGHHRDYVPILKR